MCLSVLSCTCNIWYTYRSWHMTLYCVWCFWEIIKLFPCTTWSLMEESGYRVTNGTTTLDVKTQPSYLLNTDGTVLWYCQCIYQCGGAVCCVILSVPVPMWQCSVVWYCQCLYQCGGALLYDTVSTCTNVAVLCVVWYCQCLYQCGGALLCDTVSTCTNVAVLCCMILWVPVRMCQCSVLRYCQCLYQCDSVRLCDTLSTCTNVAVLCCVILPVPVPIWQCSVVLYCQCLYQCGSAFVMERASPAFSDVFRKALLVLAKIYFCLHSLISMV
jgi:hypothetical protein